MAKHDVSFSLPERSLGRADVKFQVKRDGKVHGTLARMVKKLKTPVSRELT